MTLTELMDAYDSLVLEDFLVIPADMTKSGKEEIINIKG